MSLIKEYGSENFKVDGGKDVFLNLTWATNLQY